MVVFVTEHKHPRRARALTRFFRVARIVCFAVVLPAVFTWSRQVAAARGQEPVPGLSAALGVVSLLFLVRAVVTESTQGPNANLEKDLLWGLGGGGIVTILLQWL